MVGRAVRPCRAPPPPPWCDSRTGEAGGRCCCGVRAGPAAHAALSRRYVLCEVVSEDPRCRQCIEDRALGLAVRDAIARVHGDYGLACCSISFTGTGETGGPGGAGSLRVRSPVSVPAVKYLNAYTGTVLLRCRKDSYRLLCSALPFVRYLESRAQRYPCFLNTLHVGGQEPPGPGGRMEV